MAFIFLATSTSGCPSSSLLRILAVRALSSLHIVNLWLHSFDGFHFSSNFYEWLSIIESLEDSGGKGLVFSPYR